MSEAFPTFPQAEDNQAEEEIPTNETSPDDEPLYSDLANEEIAPEYDQQELPFNEDPTPQAYEEVQAVDQQFVVTNQDQVLPQTQEEVPANDIQQPIDPSELIAQDQLSQSQIREAKTFNEAQLAVVEATHLTEREALVNATAAFMQESGDPNKNAILQGALETYDTIRAIEDREVTEDEERQFNTAVQTMRNITTESYTPPETTSEQFSTTTEQNAQEQVSDTEVAQPPKNK